VVLEKRVPCRAMTNPASARKLTITLAAATDEQYIELANAVWATVKLASDGGDFHVRPDGSVPNTALNAAWDDLGRPRWE
jgi:hypothetical protein